MTAAQKVFGIACYAALLLASDPAYSQRSSELSDDLPDSRTMATQDKVDALFNKGDFERAFFIYRNELAPIGDKYAQYMVGYMYLTGLTGLSVEEDPIAASSWYRLSAERGTAEFVAVRDRLMRSMNEDELRLSDSQYEQLRFEYCDLAVLLTSIKRNFKELKTITITGSRIQGESNAMMAIDSRGSLVRSGAEHYGLIHAQLEDRLKLMQEIGGFQDMETDPGKVNLRELERNVKERIASFD